MPLSAEGRVVVIRQLACARCQEGARELGFAGLAGLAAQRKSPDSLLLPPVSVTMATGFTTPSWLIFLTPYNPYSVNCTITSLKEKGRNEND